MTQEEKSAIVGLWRQGNDYATIGAIFGVSAAYVKIIVDEYLKNKKGASKNKPR